jgi:serine/threonine protein kinase
MKRRSRICSQPENLRNVKTPGDRGGGVWIGHRPIGRDHTIRLWRQRLEYLALARSKREMAEVVLEVLVDLIRWDLNFAIVARVDLQCSGEPLGKIDADLVSTENLGLAGWDKRLDGGIVGDGDVVGVSAAAQAGEDEEHQSECDECRHDGPLLLCHVLSVERSYRDAVAPIPTTAASAAPGDELGGRYRLLRSIGRGGSATVFEAEDTSLERRVAIKVLHRQLSSDPAFLDRFRAEARSAAALSHPNVMAVHDWGQDDAVDGEVPFLVMELLDGGSLRAILDDGAVLSPSQAIQTGLDACRGLNYAHNEGLVHRDITPANLIFSSDGRLHIADFGLARALAESGWTEPGKDLVGTARYASPEQAQGLRLTGASDVYSLGLILVEALSGSVPFSADTMLGTLTARVESDVPIPDVPEKLALVLRAMTQRDPDARPTSNQAGVGLLKAADGMPRPSALPLVGLPEPVVEPSGVFAGGGVDVDDAMNSAPDISIDPDVTVHEVPDATQVAGTPVVPHPDDPVRRWPWLLVSIAAIAVAAWFGYDEFADSGPVSVAVPNVVGLSTVDAVEQLGATWILHEKFDRVSDVPVGVVIRTEPAADQLLEEGTELSYWVSLGRPLVRVPEADLIGRSKEQAAATLAAIGLVVGDIAEVNSEEVGRGNVISVEAEAPEIQLGEAVHLIVSAGPQSREIPEAGPGTDIESFVENLLVAGLGVDRSEEYDDDVPVGQFVTIDPPPGSNIEKGATVTLVISKGPIPVAVPSTEGRSLGDALDLIEDAGFLAGELIGPEGADGGLFARCPVIGTDPVAGEERQPGEALKIFLSGCDDAE